MDFFINTVITIFAIIVGLSLITLLHEFAHYFVARVVLKEPKVKITMGFFGKTIFNSKRLKINALFFFGAYVGNYSDTESNRFHMALLFAAGFLSTILLGIPIALYMSGGGISFGDFIPFIQGSPLRANLLSVQAPQTGFVVHWLSLATPLDFFNIFVFYLRMLIPWMILFAALPFAYPLKLHGKKLHWNPSDGLWVLKYILNKVSEKDVANAMAAINEKNDTNKSICS